MLTVKVTACEKDSSFISDDDILGSIVVKMPKYGNDSVVLDKLIVIDNRIDSILFNTTKYLKKTSTISFYMVFFEYENKLYFEITGYTPKNEFLEFKRNKGSIGYLRDGVDIYGCLEYNKYDFYILISPLPYALKKDNLKSFFRDAEEKKIIKEKEESDLFIQENPMWVYEITDKGIVLLKSINDKGYFSNP